MAGPVVKDSSDFCNPSVTHSMFEGQPLRNADRNYSCNQNMPTNQALGSAPCTSSMTHHTLLRVGSRSKVEALMAPPASDAATLRRQVESLQLDLEAHIENEQHLQAVNQQLRDRLELYMKQNHDNVEKAESEFNILHEDMEQTLELQHRLAQRSASLEKEKKSLEEALNIKMQEFEDERLSLQNQIHKMSDDLLVRTNAQAHADALQAELEATLAAKSNLETKLKNCLDGAVVLRNEVEKLYSDLCHLMEKEKRDRLLEQRHKMCLLRRFFHGLRIAMREQQLQNTRSLTAKSFAILNCSRRGLTSLQTAALRAKQIRLSYKQHAQACLEKCFKAWRLYHLATMKYRHAVIKRQKNQIHRIFFHWHQTVLAGKMSENDENRLTLISKRHWSAALKRRALRHWIRWIRYWAKPLKGKLETMQKHLEKLICGQAFALWKCFVRTSKTKRLRIVQATLHVRNQTQKRAFNRWHEAVMLNIMESLLIIKALNLRSSSLSQKIFKAWSLFVQWKHRNHVSRALAFRHYLHVLQVKAITGWKAGVKRQQAKARASQEVNRALARAAMLLWHEYHDLVSKKKWKERVADVFKGRKLRNVARNILLSWSERMRWKRSCNHVIHIMAYRRQQTLLNNALHSWMHFTLENLLIANAKFQNELLDAQEQCEAQKNQTTAVDVENLQLIDRLHAMSSDIAHLKITICEKGKQEEELHQSLEDTAVIQSTMQAELEQLRLQTEELELQSITLQKKLQCENGNDNDGGVQHTFKVEGLRRTIASLRTQIDEKSNQMEYYAKALKDTAQKLEGTSDESQEQLSNAFEIAGSLRKILEDRENQFATLEGNCRRKELEVGELQRKLTTSNEAFAETIESRDTRIRELEGILAQKQNEVQEAQQEIQDMRVSLDAKDGLVRKLEYEMKLKTDRESSRTKTFVSSMSSWSSAAGQLEALSGFQTNAHSLQMESMKHVYMQTKAALQKGISPDHCVSGYRLSAFKVQTKPSSDRKNYGASSLLQDKRPASLPSQPFSRDDDPMKSCPMNVEQLEDSFHTKSVNTNRMAEWQPNAGGAGSFTKPEQRDSENFPTDSVDEKHRMISSILEPLFREEPSCKVATSCEKVCYKGECAPSRGLHDDAKKHSGSDSSRSSNVRLFLEPVDSLHLEIQQLQTRILERMKSSSNSAAGN
ncbi:hypothetical protein KP509_01G012500 [Ceratopteris richardii]|nr:hypothetical protein KP509_01G012500 [Ceratopteris richardii]